MSSEHTILEHISKITRLREGPEGIRRILQTVYRKGPISSKALAQETYLPIPVVVAIRNELKKQGIVEKRPSGTILSLEGLQLVTKELKFATRADTRCPQCKGQGLVLPNDLEQKYHLFKDICEGRPPPRPELDQARTTPFTAFSRAMQMHEDGNLDGKQILFLGDGDLVSIAARLLGNPNGVLVIDIDEKLVEYIRRTAMNNDIEIEIQKLDLRDPLPSTIQSKFDVFSTDPPYTLQGSLLFLLRGLQLLRRRAGVAGYLSVRLSEFENLHALQSFLLSSACVFREIKRGFNEYAGAEILGNRSELFLFEAGSEFKNAILDESILNLESSI
ncbi:MAG: bis-aminopropyl spermidine synthase family protein, partial [Candidatus Hodarchaeales archaeon]